MRSTTLIKPRYWVRSVDLKWTLPVSILGVLPRLKQGGGQAATPPGLGGLSHGCQPTSSSPARWGACPRGPFASRPPARPVGSGPDGKAPTQPRRAGRLSSQAAARSAFGRSRSGARLATAGVGGRRARVYVNARQTELASRYEGSYFPK